MSAYLDGVHGKNRGAVELKGYRQKIQAAQGEALSGLFGEVLRGGGKLFTSGSSHVVHYIDDGLFWPVVGVAAG